MKYNINMKRICSFLLILLFFVNSIPRRNFAVAKVEKTVYAKAKSDCVLYKSQILNNKFENIYFVIPETYFVVVLETINDECYKVQYDKFIGYVESAFIEIASFIPIVKTLTGVECDVKETSGTQIWSTPSTNGNVLTTVSAGFKGIDYISFVYGDIPIGGETNLWFYVSYTPHTNSTSVFEGYIYSENITNLGEIVPNTETNPENLINEIKVHDENTINLSSTLKTVVVALISIPIILLISIILYKLIKFLKENTINKQNQKKLKSNEFDKNFNYSLNKGSNFTENQEQNFNQSLKDNISRFKNSSFIRSDSHKNNCLKYPKFPTYNSDDDLL